MAALPEYQGVCNKTGKVHTKLCIDYKNGGCCNGPCPKHYLHLEYCEHSFRGTCDFGAACTKLHATHIEYQYWQITDKNGAVHNVICPFKSKAAPVAAKTVKVAPVAAKTVKVAPKDPKSFAAKAAGPAPAVEVKEPPKQIELKVTFDFSNEDAVTKSVKDLRGILEKIISAKSENLDHAEVSQLALVGKGLEKLVDSIDEVSDSFYNTITKLEDLMFKQYNLREAAKNIKL
jgi:hypothetical protein